MRAPRRGDWVTLTLSEGQAEAINRRRADARRLQTAMAEGTKPEFLRNTGFMVHVGNVVKAGDQIPALIIRVWESNHDQPGDWLVNVQAFLDGTDTYWATSIRQGEGRGEFRYEEPFRYQGDGP